MGKIRQVRAQHAQQFVIQVKHKKKEPLYPSVGVLQNRKNVFLRFQKKRYKIKRFGNIIHSQINEMAEFEAFIIATSDKFISPKLSIKDYLKKETVLKPRQVRLTL